MELTAAELEEVISTATDASEKAEALCSLADKIRNVQPQQSIAVLNEAIELAIKADLPQWQAKALNVLGYVYSLTLSDYLKASECFNQALEINIKLDNQKGIANSYGGLGTVSFYQGDSGQAHNFYQKAIGINEGIGYQDGIAINLSNMSGLYEYLGDLPKALDCRLKALAIYESQKDKRGIANVLHNMGHTYRNMGDFPSSINYQQKALDIYHQQGNQLGIANTLRGLAHVYLESKDFEKARNYYEQSLNVTRTIKHERGIATNLCQMGIALEAMGQYEQAFACYEQALEVGVKINSKEIIAGTYHRIGKLYEDGNFKQFDLAKAEDYFLSALSIAYEMEEKRRQFDIHLSLSGIYERGKKWEDFALHYKKYHELEKEVMNELSIKKSSTFEMQRQLDVQNIEKEVINRVLYNILPQKIADRIKEGEGKIIERFANTSILFADMVGFTNWSADKDINELAEVLNHIFMIFDDLANQYGVEKIKTIGDAYMCVAGLPEPCSNHAERLALMALAMKEKIKYEYPTGEIKLRIGIHTGEVIAGIIGKNKYTYDLWGDAVNTASRMESHGIPEKIQISTEFKNLLEHQHPYQFQFEPRGEIEVKGKGKMTVWFLAGERC
jgi:class 3 adenylate cyclase/lipopolysaccharide biosynthesis regulator YciM